MVVRLGYFVIGFLVEIGRLVGLIAQIFKGCFTAKHLVSRTVDQMWLIGVRSLGVTLVTATFVGMAFTVQVLREFTRFGAGELIGGVVGLAVWRELGPLLTGVVIAGRVGASISAELGTMTVTEQVEALEAMSQDPIEYLVVPRVLASLFMVPLLVGIADIFGFLSGYGIVWASHKINPASYFASADTMLHISDITGGLMKAAVFGLIVGIVSCYMGLKAKGGAKGVGEQTTHAVVASLIAIFIINYFMSAMMY